MLAIESGSPATDNLLTIEKDADRLRKQGLLSQENLERVLAEYAQGPASIADLAVFLADFDDTGW